MAAKATNKTIWTIALVAIFVFLAWKLWPVLRNALNRLGGGSGGSSGGVGGGPSYYPNPYGDQSNQGSGSGLSIPGLGSGSGGGSGRNSPFSTPYGNAQDEINGFVESEYNDASDYNYATNPFASSGTVDYTSGLDLSDSDNTITSGPLQGLWDTFNSWLDQGYSPGDGGSLGQNSAQAALQDQSDELQVQDVDLSDQIGGSDDLDENAYDDSFNDASGGDAGGGGGDPQGYDGNFDPENSGY